MTTWQQIADEVNRKLVLSASPRVSTPAMLGLLTETLDELLEEWFKLTFEKDEQAIQLLSPLKQGPVNITPGTSFLIDSTLFPGGLRWFTSLRGKFLLCGVEVWRNILFMPDNDVSDLENPFRKPTNDVPKYRFQWDTTSSKKKVTILSDTAPTAIEAYYYRTPAAIALTANPETSISPEGHYKIIKRAVLKQSGIDEDARTPVFNQETNKDLQVTVT